MIDIHHGRVSVEGTNAKEQNRSRKREEKRKRREEEGNPTCPPFFLKISTQVPNQRWEGGQSVRRRGDGVFLSFFRFW
jgi:hypothetical protein